MHVPQQVVEGMLENLGVALPALLRRSVESSDLNASTQCSSRARDFADDAEFGKYAELQRSQLGWDGSRSFPATSCSAVAACTLQRTPPCHRMQSVAAGLSMRRWPNLYRRPIKRIKRSCCQLSTTFSCSRGPRTEARVFARAFEVVADSAC